MRDTYSCMLNYLLTVTDLLVFVRFNSISQTRKILCLYFRLGLPLISFQCSNARLSVKHQNVRNLNQSYEAQNPKTIS